jgi:hypothetical protein
MSRGSHWESRVAAVGALSLRARAFVADLFLYIDMWGMSWTWLHPRVFELFGIRDFF